MYFGLTDEQQELATTVRSLLARRADSQAVRAAIASDEGFDRALWQTLCEQVGVAALAVPGEYDGAGFTLFETGIVLEELGRSLAPSPLLASVIAAETLLGSTDDARQRLLPRLAAGEVATVATGSVTAEADRLSGAAERVLFGDSADVLLVVAEAAEGTTLFEVDPAAIKAEWTPAMDPTLRLARITFEDTPATRIGDAAGPLHRADRARVVAAACLQVGCAQRGLDMTVAYSKERVQFGRPIGSFQALKHRMADMLVAVETSRSAAWAATYAVATGASDADLLVAVAASHCTESLDYVAGETVQLHGGIAITWEHDAQLVFKRAHALHQLAGRPHERRATLVP